MRDQHHRGAALGGEALQQRDDLRLDRDVERGGRLIGDQQARLGGERERDDYALTHAARKLVRIVVVARLGTGNADLAQQGERAFARLRLAHGQMGDDRFLDLAADGV